MLWTYPNVDDAVAVAELGDGLGDDGLAASEGARHGTGASLHGREDGVDDPQAGGHRRVARQLLNDRPRSAHRPEVRQLHLLRHAIGHLHLEHVVLRGEGVVAVASRAVDLDHRSADVRRAHDLVRIDEVVLPHGAEDISATDGVSLAEVHGRELPVPVGVQTRHIHALGHVHRLGHVRDVRQRALDAVEDGAHDSRAQLHRQRLARAQHGVPHREARCVLIHLDTGRVRGELDDLAHQFRVAHLHQLVHGRTAHVLGDHQRPGHAEHHAHV
eukprot:scaffold405_cov243-Pinguiococcus_pyrenoidosus.AAC.15